LIAALLRLPLPGIRAFTPVFDGLCGEREITAVVATDSIDLKQVLAKRWRRINPKFSDIAAVARS
jgi:hypothetical protein